jgi:hypothetical protein
MKTLVKICLTICCFLPLLSMASGQCEPSAEIITNVAAVEKTAQGCIVNIEGLQYYQSTSVPNDSVCPLDIDLLHQKYNDRIVVSLGTCQRLTIGSTLSGVIVERNDMIVLE